MLNKQKILIFSISLVLALWTLVLLWQGVNLSKHHSANYSRENHINKLITEADENYSRQILANAVFYKECLLENDPARINKALNAQIVSTTYNLASFSTLSPTDDQIQKLKNDHPEKYAIIRSAFQEQTGQKVADDFQRRIDIAFFLYLHAQETPPSKQPDKVYEKIDEPETEDQ